MNVANVSGRMNRSNSFMRRGAGLACAAVLLLGLAAEAPAQLGTSHWATTVGGNWSTVGSWSNGAIPNAAGTLVYLSGNNDIGGGFSGSPNTINLDQDATVGYLLWGARTVGRQVHITDTTATRTLTFDTGDGKMALLSHASGDLNRNVGADADTSDVRILVTDPEGLYIENYYNLFLGGGASMARVLDGGGHDIVKAEDGYLQIARIVTNVNNLVIRDGIVRLNYDNVINLNMRPDITNVVIGAPGGLVDTGTAHPFGVAVTNFGEGGVHDRSQLPMFEVYGINNTNSATQLTNSFNLVMNRGVARFYGRRLDTAAQQNGGYKPGLISGSVTLNGNENENIFWIEVQDNGTLTGSTKQVVFAGPITGVGGFTKYGYGEMTLTGTNDFSGRMGIDRAHYASPAGLFGGVALREGGLMTDIEGMTLNRQGSFYIDNSVVNISDRVADDMWLVSRGWNAFQMYGNASAPSSESIGRVTNRMGHLAFLLDRVDGSPQAITLNLAGLARNPGSIVSFISRDIAQGALGTNVNGITINIADTASLAQVGSLGGVGTVTRSVAIGVFGGDAMDFGPDRNGNAISRSDEFMTLDGTRLRTLDTLTEMVHLGGRTNLAMTVTQASAPADANVNINFMVTNLNMNAAWNLVGGTNNMVNKVVQGAVTFNSIRIGTVSNWVSTAGASDPGATMLISDGGRLTSESGQLLFGRDVGNADGDGRSGANAWIVRGTLDLDGTNNNREAIVVNESGQSAYIRSVIEAGNGFTKGGYDAVVLDGYNRITGTVNIARGNLHILNGASLGAATQVIVSGRSQLVIENGADVRGVDLIVQEPDQQQSAFQGGGRVNTWGGDIIFKLVTPSGNGDSAQVQIYESNVGGTLNLLGDMGMDPARLSTADLQAVDAPRWTMIGGGIINLYGNVGDFIVNGEAQTYNAAMVAGHARVDYGQFTDRVNDENYVLRTTFDGTLGTAEEGNYNIYNPWRSAGTIYAAQGVIRYMGDPAAGKGNFYTPNVMTNANSERSGQTRFYLGTSSLDNNGHVIFLMTKDGQQFNAERWYVDNTTRNNTITMGLEHFGPTNATVTIGSNDHNDPFTVNAEDNRITMQREFRIYAHNGWDSVAGTASVGRVNVTDSLWGDTGGSPTLTKVGSGIVYLQGPNNFSYDEHNNLMTNLLLGGELVLDRRPGNFDSTLLRTRNSTAGTVLILAGGDVTMWGSTNRTVEYYSSNFVVRAGDSTIRSRTYSAAGSNELHIADNAGTTISRQIGGTVNFEKDLTAGGGAGFQVGLVSSARVGPWAVVSSNGMSGYAFAGTDSGRWITMANLDPDTYGAAFHTDVLSDGFGGTRVLLPAEIESETLRFNADSGIDLNGQAFRVNQGGILVTPNAMNTTSNGAATIFGGWLTSSNGEMIVHNYNTTYGFGIGAAITGVTAFTHSGTGNTTLSGANTFVGSVYLNGGTLSIDTAARLGDTNNTLEMRGGVLNMTASMDLGYRTNVLGGDGGIFRVASNMTVRMSGPIVTETNWFGKNLLNSGHGDFIKEGAGKLIIGGIGDVTITNFNGTYEGLTDIREGTLEIQRQYHGASFSNSVLGSSKSFYDGTIVRSGATLVFAYTNYWPGWNALNAPTNSMPNIYEWMIFEQGATVRFEQPGPGYQSSSLNGVLDIRGDTLFTNAADEVLFNNGAGYIMGSGALMMANSAIVYMDNPDFTGKIVVIRGGFQVNSPFKWGFDNASGIEIGLDDNVDRGSPGLRFRPESDGVPSTYNVPQNILVLGNSSSPQIGYSYASTHDDAVNILGKLDLTNFDIYGSNREFQLIFNEGNARTRDAYNGDSLRDDAYLSLLGEITGGNKRIRSFFSGADGTLDVGQVRTPEMGYNWIVTLAGTNTGWTGALEVGNRQGTAGDQGLDNDKSHVMRFGLDQGLPTWGIGSNNIVILRHNATLQAYGSQATIGTLIPDATEAVDGFWGNTPVTNTWIENGGFNPGTLTIVQVSNKVFSGGIRNGEVYERFMTNSPAAALSIVKDGPASLTLVQSNTYSGTTRILAGTLALTGTAAIAQSPEIRIDAGAFLNVTGLTAGAMTLESGQTLKGSGTMVGGLIAASGSTVAPGTSPGVLTAQNDVTFQSGSTFEVELLGTLAGQADQLLMAGAADTLTLGGATLSVLAPNLLPYLSSFVIIDGFSSLDSSRFVGLPNSGDTLTGGVNQFEIQYNANDVTLTVIPEPASLGLMGLVGITGWLLRRRRR